MNHQFADTAPPSQARITAIGSYIPERILTNQELERMVETNDEWIVQRTGIRERRIAKEEETTSDLSAGAVKNLMNRYNKSVKDVDFIIVCTSTPDYSFASVASQIQARFNIAAAGAIDLNAACAGFTYGLHLANSLVSMGFHKKVLVIGAETMSKVIDFTDRNTCILFGDGAGAVLVEYDAASPRFLSHHVGSKGEGAHNLYRTHLASKMGEKELENSGFIVQNGREVYKWAVSTVPKGMETVLEKAGTTIRDVDWFVPHSANLRMLESICARTTMPLERTLYSLEYCGNTSAASIPLALDQGVQAGKVKKDDLILAYGFGGGLTHAGLLFKWGAD
ncbi:ketoacyl-ACP synthase III [Bacillus taeanensis]|uniref:Beta-ketoacyl-[acyl-carrier-protein] synthase III n=1 Tax=Bacillus taeanensis TaxID=273032 RepID=A0A366XV65_9BACI|nr:ketoacyl-ACP synthase III [Bacillus taeanensis]RBW69546.1 ketoacyl-ACP synthase III [Bacillus taeanensis]